MGVIGLFLQQDSNYVADLNLTETGVELDEGLETAVIISLFTDQRVSDEELPLGETNKRGWPGDMYAEIDGDQIGSKIWIFENEKQTEQNLLDLKDTSKNALNWMIEDGIAKSTSVQVTYPRPGFTLIEVSITKPDGSIYAFKQLWDGQRLMRA